MELKTLNQIYKESIEKTGVSFKNWLNEEKKNYSALKNVPIDEIKEFEFLEYVNNMYNRDAKANFDANAKRDAKVRFDGTKVKSFFTKPTNIIGIAVLGTGIYFIVKSTKI